MSDAPVERHLDDIYIRVEIDGKWESRCLTDCTWAQVDFWLRKRATEAPQPLHYVIEVVRHLHERLRAVGDDLGIKGDPK